MRKMRHITLLVVLFCTMLPLAVSAGFAADAVTISARNFGAKGDGVTDDTAAIQAAIDAAAKSTGVAHLPAGKYLITNSLVIPANVTLLGEGRHWENRATQIHIKKDGFPGIRLTGFWASVKGLHILYPDNTNMKEPTRHPPAIQIEAGHAAVEDIDLSLAWDGISTPPGGANAGQSVFKNITGFAHNVGLRLAGPVDVVRIEDVHWFIPHGVDAFGNSPYYYDNRVGFEIQNVDGLVMTRCFMIFGKTFFHQTGKGSSLGVFAWASHQPVLGRARPERLRDRGHLRTRAIGQQHPDPQAGRVRHQADDAQPLLQRNDQQHPGQVLRSGLRPGGALFAD